MRQAVGARGDAVRRPGRGRRLGRGAASWRQPASLPRSWAWPRPWAWQRRGSRASAAGCRGAGGALRVRFAGSAGSVTIGHPSWWVGRAHGRRYGRRPHPGRGSGAIGRRRPGRGAPRRRAAGGARRGRPPVPSTPGSARRGTPGSRVGIAVARRDDEPGQLEDAPRLVPRRQLEERLRGQDQRQVRGSSAASASSVSTRVRRPGAVELDPAGGEGRVAGDRELDHRQAVLRRR